uniref:Uncharacterized protein At1g76660 family n=1 Tax=Cajanus cajan TaxID=3821 RepID=A0A151RGU2_CAJCA|nr:Uncharacterized protein At1g76660 family [Cajanus cajan]
MPFVAPPSSPASFLQSDPPSAIQSPVGLLSLSSLAVNAYSSSGPTTMFTIGPYAYETQLVSPPVFSNFTTEPSTAPYTPPPESVQQTTPSSPEVPFAQLLASSLDRARKSNGNQKFALYNYEFQPYQQYPGSPGGQLISPGSAISTSGTSTPFPDRPPTLEFHKGETPKILGLPKEATLANSDGTHPSNATVVDHRVSFELTGEDVARCLANKTGLLLRNMSGSSQGGEQCFDKQNSVNSSKEFIFDNTKGDVSGTAANGPEWWTNKKVAGKEGRSSNSWAFFPMLQSEMN